MSPTREEQLQRALFRGATLRLENPLYFRSVRNLLKELLDSDVGAAERLPVPSRGIPSARKGRADRLAILGALRLVLECPSGTPLRARCALRQVRRFDRRPSSSN